MTDQREERALRLFGIRETPGASGSGGLLLPEVFGAILEALLPGPRSAEILHKIIREMLSYKGERVLGTYGSWSVFCDDLLLILSDGGFISEEEGLWSNTARVIPETQVTILYDPQDRARKIRVTPHDDQARRRIEVTGTAWGKAAEFLRFLDGNKEMSTALMRARSKMTGIEEILRVAVQNPGAVPEESSQERYWRGKERPGRPRSDGRPVIHGQNIWYREWVLTAGWHTQRQAREAWNELYPEKALKSEQASAFRHEADLMVRARRMEMEPYKGSGEQNRPAHRYRWTGGDQ